MKISAVIVLIVANVALFLLQGQSNGALEQVFALYPLQPFDGHVYFRLWQLVTYSFLHGSYQHLFFNMLALWMFGMEIERYVGPRRLLACYFASVVDRGLESAVHPDAVRRAARADHRRIRRRIRIAAGLCRYVSPPQGHSSDPAHTDARVAVRDVCTPVSSCFSA